MTVTELAGDTKVCSRCGREKPVESFYHYWRDGYTSACKLCFGIAQAESKARRAAVARWHWMRRYT